MVSQVKLVLVCAFKFYHVVWSTIIIMKPKKPGNARKSDKRKLNIKGMVKMCVRNK